ncbi:head maturation protease, ClpP-related [uncultured Intestinibacter sp.]|jgi:ATP-dependent protease ClpP protease subunit|uniref:head maturation protease, ClpP-related n=1 Tax=uncultured Intestinibacter sp. TaxID=1505659 RepID=UPI0027DDA773|nr:head maturation protease, ClpP-related [uncultured Intestinibacter sp.]
MKHPKLKYRFNQLAGTNKHQLYIYDEVTEYGTFNWNTWEYEESETSANYFREQLDKIPDTDEIELFVNSYGGSVKEGIAIYNMLKRKKCKKCCFVDGFAYSVASIICLACDKIIMGLGTSMMIHDMWVRCEGNAKELRKQADDLDTLMESNRKIYLERAKNLTEEQLIEMMEKETILTPEQCLEYGFCDEISNEKQADEKQLLEAEKNNLLQMKNDLFMQKSLRQEMLDFVMLANQHPQTSEPQSMQELEEHTKCSFFNTYKEKLNRKGGQQ